MNDILQLKGTLHQRDGAGGGGSPKMLKKSPAVESQHLSALLENLEYIRQYWSQQRIINGLLIDVYHTRVMPKSRRISDVFMKDQNQKPANDFIVGSRFLFDNHQINKHVITYYVNDRIVNHMINCLKTCLQLLDDQFGGQIDGAKLEKLDSPEIDSDRNGISLTTFRHVIVDSSCIEKFDIPDNSSGAGSKSIITIYKTEARISELMKKIGIDVPAGHVMSGTTILLHPPQIMILKEKAPYLIAMTLEDVSKQSYNEIAKISTSTQRTIVDPKNEPTVGVIDTMFDESVYFSRWVEFQKMISDDIPLDKDDYNHGTAVSSLIVDGPTLNPHLDDGCGRFRVRHFCVAAGRRYSSFDIMKNIKLIVENNPDIKVWNLSLGSINETGLNSISPEAAMLDEIQYKQDVIFIVAGTNKVETVKEEKRIGAPADSINSIVVNSVNNEGAPASYSRKGLVLSFFKKPDVSNYGGDNSTKDFIRVYTSNGESKSTGTSYAAPWITRKIAYLIEILGFNREVAKALIVDAATGWESKGNKDLAPLLGHGVVPIRIEEIIQSPNHEIKFVISGISEKHDTFTYNLPVPHYNDKYPFIAKATLCYFPRCSINQGVDYTNTEMDVYLGRVKKNTKTNNPEIKSINKNDQSASSGTGIHERDARSNYHKWDNTKHICESYSDRVKARMVYEDGNKMWGISLKTKERLISRDGDGIKFGIVVTLKEISGINRIDDFIRQCLFNGWLVNKIDIKSKLEIYDKTQENIEFDKS